MDIRGREGGGDYYRPSAISCDMIQVNQDTKKELSAGRTRVVGKTKTSIGGREVLARRVEEGVKKRSHVSLMMRNDHLRQCTSGRHDFGHRTSNDGWRVRDFGPLRHPRVFSELCPFHLWWTRPLFQVHRIFVPVVRVPLRLTHRTGIYRNDSKCSLVYEH